MPRLEAEYQLEPTSMVADAENLYWANRGTNVDNDFPYDDGSIMKLTFSTGELTRLVEGINPEVVAVDEDNVYWVDDDGIYRAPKDGGEAVLTHWGYVSGTALVVDASYVYYSQEGIWRVQKDGGAPEPIVEDPGYGARGLAADATHLYWANYYEGTVSKIPKGGGAVSVLAAGLEKPWGVAIWGETAFFSAFGPDDAMPQRGSVYAVGINGGEVATLATDQKNVYELAVDDAAVFWGNYGHGPLMRRHHGGASAVLVEYVSAPAIALGPSRLYWCDPYRDEPGGGAVFSVAK